MMTCFADWAAMRPNFLVSTEMAIRSPSLARRLTFLAASRLISWLGSSTCSTTVFMTFISMRFLSSSTMTSTLSSHSGLSRRKAVSMA